MSLTAVGVEAWRSGRGTGSPEKELPMRSHGGQGKWWPIHLLSVRIKGEEIQTFICSLDKYFLDTILCLKH